MNKVNVGLLRITIWLDSRYLKLTAENRAGVKYPIGRVHHQLHKGNELLLQIQFTWMPFWNIWSPKFRNWLEKFPVLRESREYSLIHPKWPGIERVTLQCHHRTGWNPLRGLQIGDSNLSDFSLDCSTLNIFSRLSNFF